MRTAPARLAKAVALSGLVVLGGCASPQPPQDLYHRLQAPAVARMAGPILPGVTEINRLDSDGLLGQRPLAYEQADRSLAQYDYDLWTDTPPAMLRDLLVDMLAASGLAAQVVTPDLRVPADWMIRGRLLRFEHVPGTNLVLARLGLSVVSARNGRLVWMQTYQASLNAGGHRPSDAALALNQAAGQCLTQFLADLTRLPAQSSDMDREFR